MQDGTKWTDKGAARPCLTSSVRRRVVVGNGQQGALLWYSLAPAHLPAHLSAPPGADQVVGGVADNCSRRRRCFGDAVLRPLQ